MLPTHVRETLIAHGIKADADEGINFERELEYVKRQTYDIKYADLGAQRVFPVSTEAGPGAESIKYDQYDTTGEMKLISDYADDLPPSDVKAREFFVPVRSLGGSYGYSLQETRAAAKNNKRLPQRKAQAARRSYDQAVNRIAWFADGSDAWGGLVGFLYNPNIPKVTTLTGGWITTATPDQIIDDINTVLNSIPIVTKGVERPNYCAMGIAEYQHIKTTPRSATSDTTILQFVQASHENVMFEALNEVSDLDPLPSGAAGPGNVIIAMDRNPMAMTLEIPQPFEQLPVQVKNLKFNVPTHARIGGLAVYYPLSAVIGEKTSA